MAQAERILVTGVGGGVGQSILKSLRNSPYEVIGVDAGELAAGLHAVARGRKGPRADDPLFAEKLLAICREEQCRLLFPGLDLELLPLARRAHEFRAAGVQPVVSTPEVICLCDDKLATAEFLKRHGFPAPRTLRFQDVTQWYFPVFLKPQCGGSRSQGTFLLRSEGDLAAIRHQIDAANCVVQEYLDGPEYTCGTVTFHGKCRGAIVMRRELRAGDTYKAFVERNHQVEELVMAVAEALSPLGPCNIQLRLCAGKPYVFEINARCSGTTAARSLAGFNEPRMTADYLLHGETATYCIREITILRYWQELAVENDRIRTLAETGRLTTEGGLL